MEAIILDTLHIDTGKPIVVAETSGENKVFFTVEDMKSLIHYFNFAVYVLED